MGDQPHCLNDRLIQNLLVLDDCPVLSLQPPRPCDRLLAKRKISDRVNWDIKDKRLSLA
ncbi:MAG: hypothetical protein P8Q37_05660 [Porticoccaceae bacterium]|nr:hypothetical protein [Porticoccaceae bacterium]